MCWAVPGRVVGIIDEATVKVDFGGVTRDVVTGFEEVKPGDLVMVHSGVIIGTTTESEIVSNLELFMEAEKLGLQDLGYRPVEAEKKAGEEFSALLSSLGIDATRQMPRRYSGTRKRMTAETTEMVADGE